MHSLILKDLVTVTQEDSTNQTANSLVTVSKDPEVHKVNSRTERALNTRQNILKEMVVNCTGSLTKVVIWHLLKTHLMSTA